MKKPLFSVLIPVFKIEKYIEECVFSITNQSFSDFEIILIDDGSPDDCPEICERLKKNDSRIKVLHKENEGVAKARRDGAGIAEGEYVICVDGDDWLKKDCLTKISETVQKKNVDIFCFGMLADNGKQTTPLGVNYREGYYSKKAIEKEIFPSLIQKSDASYFIPSLCGKAIKRQLFLDNVLANENVTIGEDGACVISCVFHAKSMYISNECCYFYRYNSKSATKGKKVFNWEWPKLVAKHIENRIDINCSDMQRQLYRKIVHDIFSVVVSQFNRKEKYSIIAKDIRSHLEDKIYKEAIQKCEFKGSIKARIMMIVLKKRIFFPIYIYSKH
ncbi:MAG: glycosyltransferase family 2 protein [Anaerovoracaceae bacterium]